MVIRKGLNSSKEYDISLKELRSPNEGETIIGEMTFFSHVEKTSMLFHVDEKWAEEHGINIPEYKRRMDMISIENSNRWSTATHIPLPFVDDVVRTVKEAFGCC